MRAIAHLASFSAGPATPSLRAAPLATYCCFPLTLDPYIRRVFYFLLRSLQKNLRVMANIKGLSDFQDKDSDSDAGDFNDYYAGGEKRCAISRANGLSRTPCTPWLTPDPPC